MKWTTVLLLFSSLVATCALAADCQTSFTVMQHKLLNCNISTDAGSLSSLLSSLLSSSSSTSITLTGATSGVLGELINPPCNLLTDLIPAVEDTFADCSGIFFRDQDVLALFKNFTFLERLLPGLLISKDCKAAVSQIVSAASSPTAINKTALCLSVLSGGCERTIEAMISFYFPASLIPASLRSWWKMITSCQWITAGPAALDSATKTDLRTAWNYLYDHHYITATLNTICNSAAIRNNLAVNAFLPAGITLQNFLDPICATDSATSELAYLKIKRLLQLPGGLVECASQIRSGCTNFAGKASFFVTMAGDAWEGVQVLAGQAVDAFLGQIPAFLGKRLSVGTNTDTTTHAGTPTISVKTVNFTLTLQGLNITALQHYGEQFKESIEADVRAATGISPEIPITIVITYPASSSTSSKRSLISGEAQITVSFNVPAVQYSRIIEPIFNPVTPLSLNTTTAQQLFHADASIPITMTPLVPSTCATALLAVVNLTNSGCFVDVLTNVILNSNASFLDQVTLDSLCNPSSTAKCSYTTVNDLLTTISNKCPEVSTTYLSAVRALSYNSKLLCTAPSSAATAVATTAKYCFTEIRNALASANSLSYNNISSLCNSSCITDITRLMYSFNPTPDPDTAAAVNTLSKICIQSSGRYCFLDAKKAVTALANYDFAAFSQVACSSDCLRKFSVLSQFSWWNDTSVSTSWPSCTLSKDGALCYSKISNIVSPNSAFIYQCIKKQNILDCGAELVEFIDLAGSCSSAILELLPSSFKTTISSFIALLPTTVAEVKKNFTFALTLNNLNLEYIKEDWTNFKTKLMADVTTFFGLDSSSTLLVATPSFIPSSASSSSRRRSVSTSGTSTTFTVYVYTTASQGALMHSDLSTDLELYNVNSNYLYFADYATPPSVGSIYVPGTPVVAHSSSSSSSMGDNKPLTGSASATLPLLLTLVSTLLATLLLL